MTSPPTTPLFDALPLRERKHARTKVGLLHAAIQRLDERTFEEISVKELCAAVEISEPSFFNYFPKKSDLLTYFIQLWTVETAWAAKHAGGCGLRAIEAVFQHTATSVQEHPRVMLEIIAHQTRMPETPDLHDVGPAERLLAFPELDGIEDLPARGLESILPGHLAEAVERGDLPATTDIGVVTAALASIFFGVPLVFARHQASDIGAMYQRQIDLLWRGVRGAETQGANPKKAMR